MLQHLKVFASTILDVIIPHACAGCDRADTDLCEDCRALFSHTYTRGIQARGSPTCYACGYYKGYIRQAILAWKDHGAQECDTFFAQAVVATMMRAKETEIFHTKLCIVPVPSAKKSIQQRGRWHTYVLAQRVRHCLLQQGFDACVMRALTMKKSAGKAVEMQSAKNRKRRANTAIQIRSQRVKQALRGCEHSVIILDDIVTTGATLRRCVDVLCDAGAQRIFAVALAISGNGDSE